MSQAASTSGPHAPPAAPAAAHAPAVHQDYQAAKIGMWLFLFTEILLFGGLFILYSAYRARYPHEFHEGGAKLNAVIGVLNTFVLLTSSLTVAVSIGALQRGQKKLSMVCLAITIAFGAMFLVNKYIEWSGEIGHGIYPSSQHEHFKEMPQGEQLFFGLYYTMTGLHGLH